MTRRDSAEQPPAGPAIVYRDSADDLAPNHLVGFFEGWPNPPSPEAHLALLRASDVVVLAVATGDDGGESVVGFVTALTDGVLSAYIPLLEVLPQHRDQGIGRELVQRVLECLADLYMIDVQCDPDVQPFYEALGFTRTVGASIRRYEHQSGRALGRFA